MDYGSRVNFNRRNRKFNISSGLGDSICLGFVSRSDSDSLRREVRKARVFLKYFGEVISLKRFEKYISEYQIFYPCISFFILRCLRDAESGEKIFRLTKCC